MGLVSTHWAQEATCPQSTLLSLLLDQQNPPSNERGCKDPPSRSQSLCSEQRSRDGHQPMRVDRRLAVASQERFLPLRPMLEKKASALSLLIVIFIRLCEEVRHPVTRGTSEHAEETRVERSQGPRPLAASLSRLLVCKRRRCLCMKEWQPQRSIYQGKRGK